jgi:pilus assembly protein CpaF
MDGEVITTNEIFRFKRTSTDTEGTVNGHYEACGIRPRFANELATLGLSLPEDIFNPRQVV